jgi:hypothetical protein
VRHGQKIMMPQNWDEEHPSVCWNIEKVREARSGSASTTTLVNEVGEVGEDSKMLLKEKDGMFDVRI